MTLYMTPREQWGVLPQQQEMTNASGYNRTYATKKQPHSFFDTIVFVDVGPEQIRYGIHKGLLCSRSDYFKAALTGNFKEAADQVVTLDDEAPSTFRIFNAWLYTGVLVEDSDPNEIPWTLLFNIYFFAEKRIIPLLQNAAIDEIIRRDQEAFIPAEEIRLSWARTATTSPLRTLLVDLRVNERSQHVMAQLENNIDTYDVEFIAAVATRANELLNISIERWNELINLSLNQSDAEPGSKVTLSQWVNNAWELRCMRYHIHELGDTLCEGSIIV